MIKPLRRISYRSDALTSAVYVGASAIIGLVLASVSLNYIGPEIYGLWVLLQAAMFVGMMSEQGLGLAIIRLVSTDNTPKNLDLLVTSFVPAVIVSFLLVCVVIGISPWFSSYASEFVENIAYLGYVLPALGVATVFMIFGVIPCAVLTGMKRLYLVNLIKTLARALQLISACTLFFFGYSLWSLAIALLVYHVAVFFISALVLAKELGSRKKIGSYQSDIMDELWTIGSKIIVARIIGLCIDPLFKFSLGSILGLNYVTFYDLAFKIVSLISQIPMIALKGRMARYKELLEVCSGASLKKSMRALDFRIGLYFSAAFTMLYFGLELFLKLWLSGGYDPLIGVTVLFLMPPLCVSIFAHSRELLLITSGDAMTTLRSYVTQALMLPVFMGLLMLSAESASYQSLLLCYGCSHIMASTVMWRSYSKFLVGLATGV